MMPGISCESRCRCLLVVRRGRSCRRPRRRRCPWSNRARLRRRLHRGSDQRLARRVVACVQVRRQRDDARIVLHLRADVGRDVHVRLTDRRRCAARGRIAAGRGTSRSARPPTIRADRRPSVDRASCTPRLDRQARGRTSASIVPSRIAYIVCDLRRRRGRSGRRVEQAAGADEHIAVDAVVDVDLDLRRGRDRLPAPSRSVSAANRTAVRASCTGRRRTRPRATRCPGGRRRRSARRSGCAGS